MLYFAVGIAGYVIGATVSPKQFLDWAKVLLEKVRNR